MRLKMEKGVCSWCTKPGIISYTSLETNFQDSRVNICVESLNARIMENKLFKIAKDIFACKECISTYCLMSTE